MRVVLIFAIILATIFVVNGLYTKGHDGRPHCETQQEMDAVFWRNNNDPTTYWICQNLNMPAQAIDCPTGNGFLTSLKSCVNWRQWYWEEPINPPSMVYYN